jgi:hypothetical protein
MSKRTTGFLATAAILLVFATALPASNDAAEPKPVDRLIHDFAEAFNSGDFDVMASFYAAAATPAFNERRPDEEDQALYARLSGMLGKLTVRKIDVQGPEDVRMSADMKTAGSIAEFRFQLVGDPQRIDGFSVGVDPHDGEDHAPVADTPEGHRDQPFEFLTSVEGVHQAQLFVQSDGTLLLVWVQKGPHDLDLFVSRQGPDGKFAHPTRVNHQGLNRYTGDEARPSVALGPDGAVAIAWTARNNDIMLATGRQYGDIFDSPVKLNQDKGKTYRTMPSTAFSPNGKAHTIWLDPREAPEGREEPSDLYHAQIENGVVQETNLTAKQELTVCGCCRPYLAIDADGNFDIAFRNSTEGGYRDISSITGKAGALGEPRVTSPPIWKLGGCPMAGPIRSKGGTLWKDASTGSWRLLWSTRASADPEVLLSDSDDRVLGVSPRVVSGREQWVLIGAKPHSFILARDGNSWSIERDDLPPWASSAVVHDGRLILIGGKDGHLRAEIQPI